MPWLFLFAVVFLGAAVLVLLSQRGRPYASRGSTLLTALGCVVAGLILLAMSSLSIVSTRNVGIVTSFGKPVGTKENGLHAVWPWQQVPELDGTIQTNNQIGGFKDDRCSGGSAIRLANNSTACVDNTVRWRIHHAAADALFRDYHTIANIKDSLVTRELNATLNEIFAAYNPLEPQNAGGPNLTDLSAQATDKLQVKIGAQIEVQNVIISIVHFDQQTQSKINAYQAQIADTRIAEQKQKTAAAEAEANRILAESLKDPNVLVSKCLDMLNSGKQLPTGFQCWPGTGLATTIPAR
ncbi:SPFH domain-containing protein [Nocardia yamanashiensis]|uniref:SPFH domain-containing protein n=1 Tax=Nocardia yamanashiensis TaxID=209247 RepID=UPI00082C991D|nr:SPFH domain-containing protein [Nocardia yamanashiensis]